jgi:hypothetical protein
VGTAEALWEYGRHRPTGIKRGRKSTLEAASASASTAMTWDGPRAARQSISANRESSSDILLFRTIRRFTRDASVP